MFGKIFSAIDKFLDDLPASAAILAGILLVVGMLSWSVLSSRSEISEVCGDFTWPLFVGKWEMRPLASGVVQRPQEPLNLLLYPGGEAVKDGQRGSWRIVTCEGPRILIDLPRRQQTDSCELKVDQISDPERMTGTFSCAGSPVLVGRTETRCLASDSVVRFAQSKREERRRYEEEMAKASGWRRVLVWCRLKILPWVESQESRRTPPLHRTADAAGEG